MEQARYCMLLKRKHSLSTSPLQGATINPLYGDSWEEKAFAEDAAGALGGCIWPPRSYSCSFCRREFRSAQALGGHMNVHRRDRARLKQSPNDPQDEVLHHHHQIHHNPILNPSTPLDVQYPSQICTKVYNPNPNPDSDHLLFTSPSSPSRVSNEKTFVPLFSSPIFEGHHNKKPSIYNPPPWLNSVGDRYFHPSNPNNEEKDLKILGSNIRVNENYDTTDLSVSLNLVVHQTHPTSSGGKEEITSCKRRRTDSTPLLFFPKSISGDTNQIQSEVLEVSSRSVEDLDLELRLG